MRRSLPILRAFAHFATLAAATAALGQDMIDPGTAAPAPDLKHVFITQRLGEQIPLNVEFMDQAGRSVRLGDVVKERPAIVLPIFYRCQGVCNLELEAVLADLPKLATRRVGRDFDIVVLSINPKEGPELARSKFQSIMESTPSLKGTEPGWHLLTGPMDHILAVTDALGFHYTYDAQKDLVNHPSGIMFLSPTGLISSYILGAKYTPAALDKNLDLAAKNEVGQKSPDVFFGCIHIDPLTGQRSLVIANFVKLLGLLTVIALVTTILVLSGRSPFRRRA